MSKQSKAGQILDAAKDLFARFGFKKTTVEEIITHAGVSKGTFYKYYSNKDDVFQSVIEIEGNKLIEEITDLVFRENCFTDRMQAFLKAKIQGIQNISRFYNVTQDIYQEALFVILKGSQEFQKKELALLRRILRKAEASGEIASNNVKSRALILSIFLVGTENPLFLENKNISAKRFIDLSVETITRGLLSR